MSKQSLSLCIGLLFYTPFLWSTVDTQLLYKEAQQAFQAQEYGVAKQALLTLQKEISPYTTTQKSRVDWHTYIDVCMQLATCHEALEDREEARHVLTSLLATRPPASLLSAIQIRHAQLSSSCALPTDAYQAMSRVAKQTPVESWGTKNRAFFHALGTTLDHHYSDLVDRADRLLRTHFYTEAKEHYTQILTAAANGSYPLAQQANGILTKYIRLRLTETHLFTSGCEQEKHLLSHTHAQATRELKEALHIAEESNPVVLYIQRSLAHPLKERVN
jgi:tetratricopeptide (TPR) repeat protein